MKRQILDKYLAACAWGASQLRRLQGCQEGSCSATAQLGLPCLPALMRRSMLSSCHWWCNRRLDDYYYECMSMHGEEKTRVVADSLRKAVDTIERISQEVG